MYEEQIDIFFTRLSTAMSTRFTYSPVVGKRIALLRWTRSSSRRTRRCYPFALMLLLGVEHEEVVSLHEYFPGLGVVTAIYILSSGSMLRIHALCDARSSSPKEENIVFELECLGIVEHRLDPVDIPNKAPEDGQ